IDLERDPEGQVLSGPDVAETEAQLSVVGALRQRLWREAVDRVLLGPARPEDKRRVPEFAACVDTETRRIDETAPRVDGRVHLQPSRGRRSRRRLGSLAEGVGQRSYDDGYEQHEQGAPHPHISAPTL